MSESINLDGSSGRILWTLPKSLSDQLDVADPNDKKIIIDTLSKFMNSFTHLLYGSLLLPFEIRLRNITAISLFIDTLSRESMQYLKERGYYEKEN